jgi:hypothetical protein
MAAGNLTAEHDSPHVKLTFTHPDDYDHAFAVERFHGMKEELDSLGNVVMVEDWRHIHTGVRKFVKNGHNVDHHLAHHPEDAPLPPGPHKYRALAYRLAEKSRSGVEVLHTDGTFYTAEL